MTRVTRGAWLAYAAIAGIVAIVGLALAPVAIWGPAVKPDLVALALTVGGVLALERRRPVLSAALLVLAIAAKPTAGVVLVALAIWIAWRDRAQLRSFVRGSAISVVVAAVALAPFG